MVARYVGIFIGVWYVVAPFVWGYDLTFNWWHDMVLGGAVLALSASFLVSWSRTAGWLLLLVGVYSMFAPFGHGYLEQSFAFWNDLVFGVITVGTAAALGAAAIEYGS